MNNLIINATGVPSSKWSVDFKRKLKLKARALGFDVSRGELNVMDVGGDKRSLAVEAEQIIRENSLMGGRFLVVATGVFDSMMGLAVSGARKLGAEVIYPIVQVLISVEDSTFLGEPAFSKGRPHEVLGFSLWPVE